MSSMKAKKGNPFEYDVAYTYHKNGFEVKRYDNNREGLDLIAIHKDLNLIVFIECKNRNLSWNEMKKVYAKLIKTANTFDFKMKKNANVVFRLIFHPKRQPVLEYCNGFVTEFKDYKKRPKGVRQEEYLNIQE